MTGHRYALVAIAASAGGLAALREVLGALPADLPLPILVVQHLSPTFRSELPAQLGARTGLRVKWAEDGEQPAPGTVYIAPPDRHLLVSAGRRLRLSSFARVNFSRPAADPMFESAAAVYGDRCIAVVLSGMLWDGARGIAAVARCGGITIAQDEATSAAFGMPSAAIDLGRADAVMSPAKIAQAIRILCAAAEG